MSGPAIALVVALLAVAIGVAVYTGRPRPGEESAFLEMVEAEQRLKEAIREVDARLRAVDDS